MPPSMAHPHAESASLEHPQFLAVGGLPLLRGDARKLLLHRAQLSLMLCGSIALVNNGWNHTRCTPQADT